MWNFLRDLRLENVRYLNLSKVKSFLFSLRMTNGFRSSISSTFPDLKSTFFGLHILKMMNSISNLDSKVAKNYVKSYCSNGFKLTPNDFSMTFEAVNYGLQLVSIFEVSAEYLPTIQACKRFLESYYNTSDFNDVFYENPKEFFFFVNSTHILKSLIDISINLNEIREEIVKETRHQQYSFDAEAYAYKVFTLNLLNVGSTTVKPLLDHLKEFLKSNYKRINTRSVFEKIWLSSVALATYKSLPQIEIAKAILPHRRNDGGFSLHRYSESRLEDTWKAVTLLQLLPKTLDVKVLITDEDRGTPIPHAKLILPSGKSIPIHEKSNTILMPEGRYEVRVEAKRYFSKKTNVAIQQPGETLQLKLKLQPSYSPYGEELVLNNTKFESTKKLISFLETHMLVKNTVNPHVLDWVEKYGTLQDINSVTKLIKGSPPLRRERKKEVLIEEKKEKRFCPECKGIIKDDEDVIKCEICNTYYHLKCLVSYNESYERKHREDGSLILICSQCQNPIVRQRSKEEREICPICRVRNLSIKMLTCYSCGQKIHYKCLIEKIALLEKSQPRDIYCPVCKKIIPKEYA